MSAEVVTTPYVICQGKVTECCSAGCAADFAAELVRSRIGWEAVELRPGQWVVRTIRPVAQLVT